MDASGNSWDSQTNTENAARLGASFIGGNEMAQIALKLLMKLATEAFIAKMVVHGLKALSRSTENDIDDKVVKDIADALGIQE